MFIFFTLFTSDLFAPFHLIRNVRSDLPRRHDAGRARSRPHHVQWPLGPEDWKGQSWHDLPSLRALSFTFTIFHPVLPEPLREYPLVSLGFPGPEDAERPCPLVTNISLEPGTVLDTGGSKEDRACPCHEAHKALGRGEEPAGKGRN